MILSKTPTKAPKTCDENYILAKLIEFRTKKNARSNKLYHLDGIDIWCACVDDYNIRQEKYGKSEPSFETLYPFEREYTAWLNAWLILKEKELEHAMNQEVITLPEAITPPPTQKLGEKVLSNGTLSVSNSSQGRTVTPVSFFSQKSGSNTSNTNPRHAKELQNAIIRAISKHNTAITEKERQTSLITSLTAAITHDKGAENSRLEKKALQEMITTLRRKFDWTVETLLIKFGEFLASESSVSVKTKELLVEDILQALFDSYLKEQNNRNPSNSEPKKMTIQDAINLAIRQNHPSFHLSFNNLNDYEQRRNVLTLFQKALTEIFSSETEKRIRDVREL